MIYLYSGVPGSGKSLHAASDIRYALNKPGVERPVIANFPLGTRARVKRPQAFHYFANRDITPAMLVDFADAYWETSGVPFREDWLLLVLDEVQLVYNARNWQDKGTGRGDSRLDWLEFLSQHRKYGYKVVMIAQSAKMIDNQFRMLIEIEVNHRKLSTMGGFGELLSLPFGGRVFVWVSYLYQVSERLGMSLYLGKKRDWQMYDSYARFRQRELDLQRKEIKSPEMQIEKKTDDEMQRRKTQRTMKKRG